jgi:multimeric flavodoxin WrbA
MNGATAKTKVLILLGSPRKKGNTAALAKRIAQGAESAGAEVESVYLNRLQIKPCQACGSCRKPEAEGCAVDDDMQQLYPKLEQAQAVVFACPVYWFTISSQTKLVMDRWYAFGPDYKARFKGKRMAVAMSFADEDVYVSGCVNALRAFEDAFAYLGAELAGMVYGSADAPGEIENNAALMQKAVDLGVKLVRGE